jgi:hypothetical protein
MFNAQNIRNSFLPPWENQDRFIQEQDLHDNAFFIRIYYMRYKEWLERLLEKLFPDLVDIDIIVNYAILFNLSNQAQASTFQQPMQHVRSNILLRGLFTITELPQDVLFHYMKQHHSDIDENRILYFLHLWTKHPERLSTRISDAAFEEILKQIPTTALVQFAERIFKGIRAYQIAPQTFHRKDVEHAVFALPVPGYDLLYHETHVPGSVFLHGLQFSTS